MRFAPKFAPRRASTSPDQHKGKPSGSVRDWLERLDIDEHAGGRRVALERNENARVAPMPPPSKAAPSILRFEVKEARRSAPHKAEHAKKEAISNIRELRIDEPRRLRRSAESELRANPPAAHDAAALRQDTPSGEARFRKNVGPVARVWLGHLVTVCSRIIAYFRIPDTVDANSADLTGRLRYGFQAELRTGMRVLFLGVGLAGGWAVLVPLSAAVTIPGTLVVESSVKKIQYPAGGVIAEIHAQDGMRVKEGDLLVRIDETQLRANVQVLSDQLDETRARIARLTAERDGSDTPKMSAESTAQASGEGATRLLASETSLFKARLGTRESQKQLLRDNIAQLEEQIDGIDAQIKSKSAQLDLIASELKGVQGLYDKQLVPLTRLTALQREAAQLDGERSQLKSTIAETRSKISQAELQIVKIDQDLRSDVMKDLREAQDKESELTQKIVAARDQLNRVEIRSPTAGVVHQLTVHTIGGVVAAGEVIMEIVPDSDDLQIEAKLPPVDIDHVHLGQDALVRFSAFNQRTTPQLHGKVSYVSADLTQDAQSKSTSYYTVRVSLTAGELHRLGNLQLVSGMPAELFLQTGSRTMMSYLLKPITDQLKRTFSEP
jgi:HlyD family secretion protein